MSALVQIGSSVVLIVTINYVLLSYALYDYTELSRSLKKKLLRPLSVTRDSNTYIVAYICYQSN